MSEFDKHPNQEITDTQRRLFVERIQQLLPDPNGVPVMEAEACHLLDDERICLSWLEWDGGLEVSAGVSTTPIETEEHVAVGAFQKYTINGDRSSFRSTPSLFLRAKPVDLDRLSEIFTPQYLQPITEEYQRLKNEAEDSSGKTFTIERFNAIMSKLYKLGPDTVDVFDLDSPQ